MIGMESAGRIGIIRDPDGVKIELVDRADLRDLQARGRVYSAAQQYAARNGLVRRCRWLGQ
jgi:hypothetical protein